MAETDIMFGDPGTGVARQLDKMYIGDPSNGLAREIEYIAMGHPVTGLAQIIWKNVLNYLAMYSQYQEIYISYNTGESWEGANPPTTLKSKIELFNDKYVAGGHTCGFPMYSYNLKDWTYATRPQGQIWSWFDAVGVSALGVNVIGRSTSDGQPYSWFSTDGVTYNSVVTLSIGDNTAGIAMNHDGNGAMSFWTSAYFAWQRTRNGGASWTHVSSSYAAKGSSDGFYANGTYVFQGYYGISYSKNLDAGWTYLSPESFDASLKGAGVIAAFFKGFWYFFAQTTQSASMKIFKSENSDIASARTLIREGLSVFDVCANEDYLYIALYASQPYQGSILLRTGDMVNLTAIPVADIATTRKIFARKV